PGWKTLSEAFRYDVKSFEDRVEYLLAAVSCAYANRDRVRTQLLGMLIPYYKTTAQEFNNELKGASAPAKSARNQTYRRLMRFLEMVQTTTTRVFFVAIPIPSSYPLDSALTEVVRRHNA